MCNIVKEDVCFTLDSAREQMQVQVIFYNKLNILNDAAAVQFFLALLDEDIE